MNGGKVMAKQVTKEKDKNLEAVLQEIEKQFDVFERWDTILNRDISSYLTNYGKKWQVRSQKQ